MPGRRASQTSQTPPIDFEHIAKQFRHRRRKLSAKKLLGASILPQPRARAKISRVEEETLSYIGAIPESNSGAYFSPKKLASTEPRPTFTYGYSRTAIHPRLLDLQNNIKSEKAPYTPDLSILSQPINDCFWPFLVINVHQAAYPEKTTSPESTLAIAATACSDAIHELAALSHLRKHRSPRNLKSQNSFEAAQSFSLYIDEARATLKTYVMREDGSIVEYEIQSFHLRRAADLEELRAQLESILYWGWRVRLPIIVELLGRIMHHMHGQSSEDIVSWPSLEAHRGVRYEDRKREDGVAKREIYDVPVKQPVIRLWHKIFLASTWIPCLGRPKTSRKEVPPARDISLAFRSPELE